MFRSSLLFLFLVTSWVARANGPVLTFETRQDVALERASSEGKNVFIIFKAQWCTPCLWMETTTFQDETVRNTLATYYIPVKADIDEGDGFVLFYDHGVQVLPTMIILNEDGQVLERIEESLGQDKLLQILVRHSEGLTPVPATANEASSSEVHAPGLASAETPAESGSDNPMSPTTRKTPETFDAPPAAGYSVQVGVFTLYPNVLSKILEIQAVQDRPVHVEETRIDDVVVYKLLSGHFATRSEAEAWRASLAEARIPGYIRDLRRS